MLILANDKISHLHMWIIILGIGINRTKVRLDLEGNRISSCKKTVLYKERQVLL
jgi:hypothetical protein